MILNESMPTLIKTIKDHLINKQPIPHELDKLRTLCTQFNADPRSANKAYILCLQSLLTFKLGFIDDKSTYDMAAVEQLLGKIEVIYDNSTDFIWIHPQHQITLVHAFIQSKLNHVDFFKRVINLFHLQGQLILNKKEKCGFTPLNSACHEGKNAYVADILAWGKTVLDQDQYQTMIITQNHMGYSPLLSSTNTPSLLIKLINEFKENEILPEINNSNGENNTALHKAAFELQSDSVKILLHYRANVFSENSKGQSPLAIAVNTKCFMDTSKEEETSRGRIVKNLTERYYSPSLLMKPVNKFNENIFHRAAVLESTKRNGVFALLFKVAERLEIQYACLTTRNKEDQTPLDKAIEFGSVNMVDTILEYAAPMMDIKTYIIYTKNIYWGENSKLLLPLLYQTKTHFSPEDFLTFMTQKHPEFPLKKSLWEVDESLHAKGLAYIKQKGMLAKFQASVSYQGKLFDLNGSRRSSEKEAVINTKSRQLS